MNKNKIIAALVLLPFFIWLAGWGKPSCLLILVLLLAAGLGAYELGRMTFKDGRGFHRVVLIVGSVSLCLAAQTGEAELTLIALCTLTLLVLSAELFIEKDLAAVLPESSRIVFGAVYLGLLSGLVVALKRLEPEIGGSKLVLILFALTWAGDAGAFFVGSYFGRRKLWPAVSAGKTQEGLLGGYLFTLIVAAIIGAVSPIWTVSDMLLIGAVIGGAGPLGDLVESAIKRGAGVKDSGVFLPGHGGVLDRLDSVLFTAPLLYFFAIIVGPARLLG